MLGEANFSDHGANRLGASALMQGLADGYFVIPYTIGHYLASTHASEGHDRSRRVQARPPTQCSSASTGCSSVKGNRGIREIHRELGRIMWDDVGMARTEAGLKRALDAIPKLREEFWQQRLGPGHAGQPEPEPRVRRPRRRLPRVRANCSRSTRCTARESCGGHFREESQTPDGEALRDDEHFSYVAAWEFKGVGQRPDAAQGAARVRGSASDTAELQVDETQALTNLAAGRTRTRAGGSSTTPPTTSRPTCRSSRCSTSSTKG